MNAPEKMTEKAARLWLSEALGEELPAWVKVKYHAGKIYKLDERDGSINESVIRNRGGVNVCEPSGVQTVEVYDVRNIYGECEDAIPLNESPFAAQGGCEVKSKSLTAQFKLAEKIAAAVARNQNADHFVPLVYVMDAIAEFEREGFEINIATVEGGAK